MNKRDALIQLLEPSRKQPYIPAAFFLHFDANFHQGQAAVDKHLEYFRHTDMDFVKIQYERIFPRLEAIQRPEDWREMPYYHKEFYDPQLQVVKGLIEAAKEEALVIITLYSPFMCAGHSAGLEVLTRHIYENPQAVQKGMEIITASLMVFVQECIEMGVDGFYHSTQGGESGRFSDPTLFAACVKPYDLALMEEINRRCIFNILHICDYNGGYDDLTPFLDYPGDVVSCPLLLGDHRLELQDVAHLFDRPVMGGLDRHGVLVDGNSTAIQEVVQQTLQTAPNRFILGADCTVPSTINWDHLRLAIDIAHTFHR